MRKAFTVLGALAMMLVAAVAPAQADVGTAAFSCSGSVTYSKTVGVGKLVIYYQSAAGGTNTACYYHVGASKGVAAPTFVEIARCAETSGEGNLACTYNGRMSDGPGNWASLAGPVGVTQTDGRCVAARGYIVWQGSSIPINSGRQGCPRP